jgi:hypothetical protein
VSNEKNLPSPFGDNVSWKYVKSSNTGEVPLFADTNAPSVSFTCEEWGEKEVATPMFEEIKENVCENDLTKAECELVGKSLNAFSDMDFDKSMFPPGCFKLGSSTKFNDGENLIKKCSSSNPCYCIPKRAPAYEKITEGVCQTTPINRDECEKIAKSINADAKFSTVTDTFKPPNCYSNSGTYYHNDDLAASGSCTAGNECYRKKEGEGEEEGFWFPSLEREW